MMKRSLFGIIALSALMLAIPNAYSAEPDMVTYLSISEITQTSITLAEQSLEDGDFDNAKKLIEFGSKQFSNNLEKLREADASLTDEVHISLIDLQTKEWFIELVAKFSPRTLNLITDVLEKEQVMKQLVIEGIKVFVNS